MLKESRLLLFFRSVDDDSMTSKSPRLRLRDTLNNKLTFLIKNPSHNIFCCFQKPQTEPSFRKTSLYDLHSFSSSNDDDEKDDEDFSTATTKREATFQKIAALSLFFVFFDFSIFFFNHHR